MPKSVLPSLALLLAVLASCFLTTRVLAFQQEDARPQHIEEAITVGARVLATVLLDYLETHR